MIRSINVGDTIDYTLKEDKEDPTVWVIGVLDSLLQSKLFDLGMVYKYNPDAPADSVAEAKLNIGEQDVEYVRFGLKGIKNFKNKDGNDIKFSTIKKVIGETEYTIVSDETLKCIPKYAIRELAQVIAAENKIKDEERKNS